MMPLGADLMQSRFAAPAKKLRGHRRGLLNALSFFSSGGAGGLYAGFPIAGPISLLFFHAAQAPLRVSQNDSSGQAVFLGQLVEEGLLYTQSVRHGGGKWRQFDTSRWSVQPPKNAQSLCQRANPMPPIGPASI
jgi:hypothetical protein